ncbi:unnamed protein product, partial [Heterosigma akashiwo]
PKVLNLNLVGQRHSLWGNRLWNAARYLADTFDNASFEMSGKTTLELGSGAGLPSLICALRGAESVVITDYASTVDTALVDNIQKNIDMLGPYFPEGTSVHAQGLIWGYPPEPILNCLEPSGERKFDLIILAGGRINSFRAPGQMGRGILDPTKAAQSSYELSFFATSMVRDAILGDEPLDVPGHRGAEQAEAGAEAEAAGPGGLQGHVVDVCVALYLLFNHSEHTKLLETCDACLSDNGVIWVTYGHHVPQKAHKDMKFFELAVAEPFNFISEKIDEQQWRDIIEEHDGLDQARGVVYTYHLRRRKNNDS